MGEESAARYLRSGGIVIRAIFLRNLRHHCVLLAAIWLGIGLFEAFLVWVAAQIDMGPGLRVILEQLVPAEIREAFFAQLGLASFEGAVSFGFQHPFVLVGAVAFIIVAATVPTGERESGFLDVVLAHPVPRSRYLAATALLVILGALMMPGALLMGVVVGLSLVEVAGEPSWSAYVPSTLGLVALLFAVGGYSLLFGSGVPRRGIAAARAAGVTLVLYWLDFLGDYWDSLRRVRWLSPFYYFDPVQASLGSGLGLRDPLLLLGVFFVCSLAALAVFHRQDL